MIVAMLCGQFADGLAVRKAVKALPAATVVVVDDEPFQGTSAVLREARCSDLVCVQVRQPGNGKKAIEARAVRDEWIIKAAQDDRGRVVVFGKLAPDRELTLRRWADPRLVTIERIE